MSTKSALKSVRLKLQNDEPEGALHEATQLLRSIGEKDPEAPTVLAFRALALTHVERLDEAEKSYHAALRLAPGHHLALPGLKKLYIKNQRWDDLGRLLELQVQAAYDTGDAEKASDAMQEVMEHRLAHGPNDKLYGALRLLLPSSPLVPLIQSAPVPQGSYLPLQVPKYPAAKDAAPPEIPRPLPHVHHLAGSLALVTYLLLRVQAEIYTTTEVQVKAGRQRLGAGTERDVRRRVDAEVLGGPQGAQMIDLLRDVSSHPSVDEDMRRLVEVQEFRYWRRLVSVITDGNNKKAAPKASARGGTMISASLPPKPTPTLAEDPNTPALFRTPETPKITKAEAGKRTEGLAKGFVLLEVGFPGAEEAWAWVIEGRDEPTIEYDHNLLLKFAKVFRDSAFTDFIDDYARLLKLPLPEPDEEQPTPAEDSGSDKKKKYRRPTKGQKDRENARARRKARREAVRDGELVENLTEEEREELIATMTKTLDSLKTSIFAHRVMTHVAIQEEDWANAITYAEKARKLVREVETERGITLPKAMASLDEELGLALVPYYPPKHHQRASRLLNGVLKLQPANYAARFGIGQILEVAGDWSGAQDEFKRLLDQGGEDKEMIAAKEELGWCLVNQGKLTEGRDVLEEVVEVRDTRKEQEGKDDEALVRARAWWRLGRTEWMIGDDQSRTQAEEWFMASLRADASFAASYTALGICYAEAHSPPDMERALKCFQKAFELDATEADAARRLAFAYADVDEWAQVRAIAMRVMEGEGGVEGIAGGEVMNAAGRFAPTNGWAWKALGSTEMYYKNYAKAIQAFQVALRADPEDASMWRMLGDAYVKSGRHMAGLKALQKALEIDPTMWMAHYHMGETYMQLGDYAGAIAAFKEVDSATESAEVGVTAALAEAAVALGRFSAAGGFRERSRSAFHTAIGYALRVLTSGRSHRAWAWKLIGDAALQLAEREVDLKDIESTAAVLQPVLEHLIADDDDRRSSVTGLGHASNLLQAASGPHYAVKAAVFAFAYRAHLLKNEHSANSALYDLGCALHTLATRDEDVRTPATKAAISAVRLALERDASDERLWNALGVICSAAGQQLAQHAFVVSLELYAKDPEVWTNLGFLYLRAGDRELANQCFLKAQTLDPDCARAWFGQAILAQRDGQHHASAGLFAHSATLSAGSLLEADLALALGAFGPFLNPHTRDTTPLHQAAFALACYVAAHPEDAEAKHLQALVSERLGLTGQAVAVLEDATQLLEDEFERSESAQIEANYATALLNLARVRLAAGQYDAALSAFKDAAELSVASSEERVTCQLAQARTGAALAHFWLGDHNASLEGFQAALDAAKNDDALTDEIAVLFARTLWSVGGEDAAEAAKTQLMESLEHERPSLKVIAALGAAALASSDADLLDAALAELANPTPEQRAQDPQRTADAVLAAAALANGNEDGAIASLESSAASAPWDPVSRNRLAAAYVAAGKTEPAIALLQRTSDGPVLEAARANSMRGIALTLEGESGMQNLQRAIMLRPWDEEGWEALAWARRAEVELEES
ncbi:hypothetical protein CcaverHIS002_0607250 [Cutaneotrichosporon cavernicola]|uniref:Superkiller protein 3 n=1 Tax=Cutaneotrichosporon cavernicola TaxID=279322 RepID=A0AA48L916_9TREE|nr:uncharacterized protein CcaverHIS019_0606670 [Cutaneotrichosporon cavernicola]BEI86438.1 hypothetical protein CcaverHIS002_0607250 [Cutaneotrichosporon cavernicola]BEI94208.1 hypothetical protein CcaverHIS019_0606670 [Cutaneotrichosporon cavernicola]BEJ01988.1 hypothetical protein CcaverHIS631_0606700 [Cutaneotrichosporon cavernicola]BEJ09751.1 hypothetical protein CcaverHIS641_0606660 [Cutaneotrichosporon cavernicola]